MKDNTMNLMILLVAVFIIVVFITQCYDNFELSVAPLGLNLKASCDRTTLVNIPLVSHELGLSV